MEKIYFDIRNFCSLKGCQDRKISGILKERNFKFGGFSLWTMFKREN